MAGKQITLPDPSALSGFAKSYGFYLGAAAGIATIVANHYGVLPSGVGQPVDPANWVSQIWGIVLACFAHAGLVRPGTKLPDGTTAPPEIDIEALAREVVRVAAKQKAPTETPSDHAAPDGKAAT
jgi:hypothetical protein